jgi:hypothetical protein
VRYILLPIRANHVPGHKSGKIAVFG